MARRTDCGLLIPPAEASSRISSGLEKCGISAETSGLVITGKSGRSLMKNRWAADVQFELEPAAGGCLAVARVEMNGNKLRATWGDL